MPKITTFLSKDTIRNLKDLCKKSGKSLSKTTSELVEIGYEIKQFHNVQGIGAQEEKNKNNIEKKHTEYLLRIMAIVADCYRCIRNNRSRYNKDNVDDVLAEITANVRNYIGSKK